jgi:hypothetical protein
LNGRVTYIAELDFASDTLASIGCGFLVTVTSGGFLETFKGLRRGMTAIESSLSSNAKSSHCFSVAVSDNFVENGRLAHYLVEE